ncbi:MAG: CRISPR-associated protein Csx19 [Bacillota bacterium]
MRTCGAVVEQLGERAPTHILSWVGGGKRPAIDGLPEANGWLLAHCDDGVTWGYLRGDSWHLSGYVFPEVSPIITGENLQELRVFDDLGEVMLWRQHTSIVGRVIRDLREDADFGNPFHPYDETYVLWGSRLLAAREGFSLVGEPTGIRHAVPLECSEKDFPPIDRRDIRRYWHPLRLDVRHYFSECRGSGAVRPVACRLVRVRKEACKA